MIKKERNMITFNWVARFVDDNKVLATTDGYTEVYKYNKLAFIKELNMIDNNELDVYDLICEVLEDEDLLNRFIESGDLFLIDTIEK